MKHAPDTLPEMRPFPALRAEEHIVYQLADLGLRLHKLGRHEAYRQVIAVRNDLLEILDDEPARPVQHNKVIRGDFSLVRDSPAIDGMRSGKAMLKVVNHAR